jgi:hypothetical protein
MGTAWKHKQPHTNFKVIPYPTTRTGPFKNGYVSGNKNRDRVPVPVDGVLSKPAKP